MSCINMEPGKWAESLEHSITDRNFPCFLKVDNKFINEYHHEIKHFFKMLFFEFKVQVKMVN